MGPGPLYLLVQTCHNLDMGCRGWFVPTVPAASRRVKTKHSGSPHHHLLWDMPECPSLAPSASVSCTGCFPWHRHTVLQVPVWITGKVCSLPVAELGFTPRGVIVQEGREVLVLKSWHWWKPRTPGSYPLFCSLCFGFCQRRSNAIVACKWGAALTWLEHRSQPWSIFR